MIKLSVIVVNYNVKYFLEQCLLSVRKAAARVPGYAHETVPSGLSRAIYPERGRGKSSEVEGLEEDKTTVEIFVVDNNSVDASVEMVHAKFPEVSVIENHENKGFSTANNQAIKKAKGEYVLILNPDTVLEEDTFTRVLEFMDKHPEAGGLGVKMLDGQGFFLPESKRAFPSPSVAFYKISGLAALFPRSRMFGQYHLGYLDENKIHEISVLSGAFMLVRREVLDKIGAFDEDYFMYGEDIDLSFRIIKAGYKNYYFPQTRIIHYKGESTKKGSLNYIRLFYQAMIIFSRKHLKGTRARIMIFFIQLAVYLRAGLALGSNVAQKAYLFLLDASLIYVAMLWLKDFWGHNIKGATGDYYPAEYVYINLPAYIGIWLLSVYFSGGYDKPSRSYKVVRGILFGTLLIAALYGFLEESYRFSRAMIVLGAGISIVILVGVRFLMHFLQNGNFRMEETPAKKTVIVGNFVESQRVKALLDKSEVSVDYLGFVAEDDPKDAAVNYLGTNDQLAEVVEVYGINQVIFCASDISSQNIIEWMSKLGSKVEFKIVPEHSLSIIGSNSRDSSGDLYALDIDLALTSPAGRRNKRVLDLLICAAVGIFLPIWLIVRNPTGLFRNCWEVFLGLRSWVGVAGLSEASAGVLSKQKPGVLNILDGLGRRDIDKDTQARLNLLYARNYSAMSDLRILLKGIRDLGRR